MVTYVPNYSHVITYAGFFNPFVSVSDRRDAVVQRRQRVKTLEQQRASQLQASLAWQQFSRDADEVIPTRTHTHTHTHTHTPTHPHTHTGERVDK